MSESRERVSGASQSTDSAVRLLRSRRTEGLTKNLQDQGDSLTYLNTHEASGKFDRRPEPEPLADGVDTVLTELKRATDRGNVRRLRSERAPLNEWLRHVVLHRDRYHCAWCGANYREDFLEIDHLIPWSAGGSNATDNLRTLCRNCNQSRSNMRTDYAAARPVLIVHSCPRDRARFDSEWTGEPVTEWSDEDREVPVFCIQCNGRSTASRMTARIERQRQDRMPPGEVKPHLTHLPAKETP